MMNFNEYQEKSKRTMPELGNETQIEEAFINYTFGLVGESAEYMDHIKKFIFHGHDFDYNYTKEELGDVLHYLAGLATLSGFGLEEIAQGNIEKLKRRYPNGFSEERSVNRDDWWGKGKHHTSANLPHRRAHQHIWKNAWWTAWAHVSGSDGCCGMDGMTNTSGGRTWGNHNEIKDNPLKESLPNS
jgi:NTP pyrophosphatase (non-canonical NTP hydrolase)